jgi:hypothetical protein
MRKELLWIAVIIAFSILLIAISTSFRFNPISTQLHDTYFVLGSVHVIIFLSFVLITGRYTFQFILFLIDRSKPFAIALAMIIPPVLYLIAVYIYIMGSLIRIIANSQNGITLHRNSWPIYVPGLIVIVALITLETIAIRKIAAKK